LAILSGANVKVVQQMLGHNSATLTLDLYRHLFGDQLDEVGERLDAAASTLNRPHMPPSAHADSVAGRSGGRRVDHHVEQLSDLISEAGSVPRPP
jgi:hypothetical protein